MPVTVVVGGQYGSEGKGKVALEFARRGKTGAVVRVGGTNSGHTGVGSDGRTYALKQLPAAALANDALVILPAGSFIDIDIFVEEMALLKLGSDRVKVDAKATVILAEDKIEEETSGIVSGIGSTGSGTGAALRRRISREGTGRGVQASDHPALQPLVSNTTSLLRRLLARNERVIIEGTQGFGLSVLHGGHYPKATSRDTTAGTFVGEAGLSPLDVDEVVLVLRSFPIRVAGNSGPLPNETTWQEIAAETGLPEDYCERTTVTQKVRRVARFDAAIVRRAIEHNKPTEMVLNHLDYIDASAQSGAYGHRVRTFVEKVEREIEHSISWIGTGPSGLIDREQLGARDGFFDRTSSAEQTQNADPTQIRASA